MGVCGKWFLILAAVLAVVLAVAFQVYNRPDTEGVPVVEAPSGKVAGTKYKSRDLGRTIFAYKGIPYATPPVGDLRFQRTQRLPKWSGTLEAFKAGPKCVQPSKLGPFKTTAGQEDCLYLNVYVPEVAKNEGKKLPVMVWIHGGGLLIGDGSDMIYGPKYLLDKDIIMVSFNYRLGPLGFLNLGTEAINGNQGIWDQRTALEWVQDNIAAFGGDPKQVTIFGESAGGWSVLYHLTAVEGERKNLFKAAIVQSGPIHTNNFLINYDRSSSTLEGHKNFANDLNCTGGEEEVIRCLKNLDPKTFVGDTLYKRDECNLIEDMAFSFPGIWAPSVDGSSKKSLYPEHPTKRLDDGKILNVPLMTGFNKEDGILFTGSVKAKPGNKEMVEQNWDRCIGAQVLGKRQDELTPHDYRLLSMITQFYLGEEEKQRNLTTSFQLFTDMITDARFAAGTERTVRSVIAQGKSPVYYYHFNHVGSFSLCDMWAEPPSVFLPRVIKKMFGIHTTSGIGVAHLDEVLYILSSNLPFDVLSGEEDLTLSKSMVDLWTNFAMYGEPTPKDRDGSIKGSRGNLIEWTPSTIVNKDVTYVTFEAGKMRKGQNPEVDRRHKFWRSLSKRKQ